MAVAGIRLLEMLRRSRARFEDDGIRVSGDD